MNAPHEAQPGVEHEAQPGVEHEAEQDAPASSLRAGFRLRRFEVYNWGTFDARVWRLQPDGDNMLLTGDIGSGKSTIVDALTTLLVPANKVSYNKAAGADARERTLRTYVLGHFKSERGDTGMSARAVALRDHRSYSVLLGEFCNEGYEQTVTLAQVFWFKDPRGQPERFYVVAESALAITEHFSGFGSDVTQLRKRLRATAGVTLHDSFPTYGADFRRRFGIGSEQAMDLFQQTVSMKSVGSLTEFVREHMLEPFPVQPRIDALITHFDNLNRAHEAVLKARAQIERLQPLTADCNWYAGLVQQVDELHGCRDELRPWFAHLEGEHETIRERVDTINASLHAVDYNPNRYIALEAAPSLDADLRDFQQDLRSCTEGSLTGSADEEYTEAKFLQVPRIIERLRGREGSAEMDRRWTRKVTDVRDWFVFSVSERWREDNREHGH